MQEVKNLSELNSRYRSLVETAQLTFTCSKLTKETLEEGVKYVQS